MGRLLHGMDGSHPHTGGHTGTSLWVGFPLYNILYAIILDMQEVLQ